jgi:peptide/nickel transport system permease protein
LEKAQAATQPVSSPPRITRRKRWEPPLSTTTLILQRLAFGALVLVSIIFLSHLGLGMARGSSFQPALTRATSQTLAYLGRLVHGDLGLSAAGSITLRPVPVAEVVPAALLKSLGLLATALLIAALVGVALGLWAAARRHSRWSLAILMASIIGVSVPSFFAALLLQLAVLRWARLFGQAPVPVGGFGWDAHIVLPALVLAARPVAQIARITFVSVSDVLGQDFVRTAYGKGLRSRQVMSRHVIRNAAIPVLTTLGVSLRFSLSSLPVVEFFFGWPGAGFFLLKAISRQDDNLTVALVLALGALFILINLLLDIGYRLIDPRLRERPAHVERGARGGLAEVLEAIVAEVRDLLTGNPLWERLVRRRSAASQPALPERRRTPFHGTAADYRAERRRAWLRGTLGNLPFVIGALLMAALVGMVLFGPRLAPHSPYTTQGLLIVDGELRVPPFAPDKIHPWGTDALGRDMMSLILAGAQQTLLLAALVVLARMGLGLLLGALAGWRRGSWIDRLVLGAAETIAAFPALLLAMILILALGIRQGLRPFVIALAFVGWGEVMQFVRAEVMAIRPRPFIESAVAVGLRIPRIIVSHVLPNLAPALIAIAALEMGAVLMLLGELGFIGIFIGGGAFAELAVGEPPYHYSDVPEWGALLSNIRHYARTYPWMGLYPALAFFVAILGFNLFGEGVRRMVESVGVGVTRLVNRYTLMLALLTVLGIGWVRDNTGPLVFYRRQASAFDGQRALAHVQVLADPALEGRALGTPRLDVAAEHIARQFEALGLQAGGEEFTYFQTRSRAFQILDAVPQLAIEDGGPPPVYRHDYAEYPGAFRNLGQARGRVHFLALGDLTAKRGFAGRRTYPALQKLDYSDEILLVLSPREAAYLWAVPRGGVLVVAEDAAELARKRTLSPRDPVESLFGAGRRVGQDAPMLWISEELADRLLHGTGYSVAELRRMAEELGQDELLRLSTGTVVTMAVRGTVRERVKVRHVIGHLPGTSDQLDNRLIVVLAQYDSPPPGPDHLIYPGANDNASGVAVMLEAIRTMRETGYQPYKTLLFVAYSGEGLEGGKVVTEPEVKDFLKAKYGFTDTFEIEAVIHLRGLGAGTGRGLALAAGGSTRLANLFEASARRMGVRLRRIREPVELSIVFEEKSPSESGQEAPTVRLFWEGWEATSRTPADTPEVVSAEKLEQAGRALTLALMVLGRETGY